MENKDICLNCGVMLGPDQYGVCSDKCEKELMEYAHRNDPPPRDQGPVSYCCICGGYGMADGSKCWGCQS